jgi:ubiquinone/menaquinone biosynthesis C-methylase UbiE
MNEKVSDPKIKEAVRQTYGGLACRVAESDAEEVGRASCCGSAPSASCCGSSQVADEITERACGATRFYSAAELESLPISITGASAGCGNPLAIADLQPGEVVLDLGSGGGIDCFLAAQRVGPEGRVIGLDMTPEMIELARRNAQKIGAANVEFRYGEIEDMPLPDESVDVIISNCVINLSPDKDAVFREALRVLRPGGRLNISDIVVNGELPRYVRDSLNAWADCVAGALKEADYVEKIRAAGFEGVKVISREYAAADLAAVAPESAQQITSVKIAARKPV